MKHLSIILLGALCLIIILLPACAEQPQPVQEPSFDREAAEEAIARTRDQLITALNADDVDGIMACLTDDHVTMPPDVPTPKDLNALREYHQDRVDKFSLDVKQTLSELEFAGDWAIEHFANTGSLTPRAGGDAVPFNNKGIWIWKPQLDGSWKLALSIWNNDSPLPPPPTT
jgi:ketosteroid isomerase-like protein